MSRRLSMRTAGLTISVWSELSACRRPGPWQPSQPVPSSKELPSKGLRAVTWQPAQYLSQGRLNEPSFIQAPAWIDQVSGTTISSFLPWTR